MRILFLNPTGQLGGAETSLLALLQAIRRLRRGWNVKVLLGAAGPLVGQLHEIGVPSEVLPMPESLARMGERSASALQFGRHAFAAIRYLQELRRSIAESDAHIVHATGFKMQVLASYSCPDGVPLIWHIHDYVSHRRVTRTLLRLGARRCAIAITNSRAVGRDLARVCTGTPYTPLYNTVDLHRFSPFGPAADLDEMCSLPPCSAHTCKVGLVATFAHWKGHSVFLRALSQLGPEVDVRGYIIGGPIYQTEGSQRTLPELKAEARALGLEGRIGFTGFTQDAASVYRALDVVVHASTEPEPFGMVLIEALACGKPVIASDSAGALEVISTDGCITYPSGDVQRLAQAIRGIASAADFGERMAQISRRTIREVFSGETLVEGLEAVYARVAKQSRSMPVSAAPAAS